MNYGYIRVSTDTQDLKNQNHTINEFANKNNLVIDGWIEETISGGKDYKKRLLYPLMKRLKPKDKIICVELSRLGRSLLMIMEILKYCLEHEIGIWTIRDNYRLSDDITSKVLAFAFGLSAEIERNLISQRTKDALKKKKDEGIILGRPVGRKSSHVKLTGREELVFRLKSKGFSNCKIARKLKVHRETVRKFYVDIMRCKNVE